MKATISSFLLVALTASTLTNMVYSTATKETQDRIDNVCRSMEDYQFCNQTFNNNLPQPDTDNVGLTKITITEGQKNASNTLDFIRAQIPGEKDPDMLNRYKVCENAYSIVQNSFNQASSAFDQKDYKDMAQDERDMPRALASCTTIFITPPIPAGNPLFERNREMRILITMAVVTGTLIAN